MNLFNLFATLTLDTSKYDTGVKNAEKSGKSLASNLGTSFKNGAKAVAGFMTAVVGVGAAIAGAAIKVVDFGDDIGKTSQKLGLSTDAYQKWAQAATMAGTDVSTLQVGIRQLNTFIEQLSKGQGDALLTLQKLDIGYEDFMAMNFDDQLYTIVTAMQGVENQTDKARVAQELFGNRAYMELMPLLNQEAGSVDELFKSFEDLGIIIDEKAIKQSEALSDKFSLLKSTTKSLAFSMSSDLGVGLNDVIDGLQGIVTGADGATETLTSGLMNIIDKVSEAAPVLIDKVAELALNLINGLASSNTLASLVSALVGVVEKLLIKITDPSFLTGIVNLVLDLVVALLTSLANADWTTILTNLVDAVFDIVFTILERPDLIASLLSAVFSILAGISNAIVEYYQRYFSMITGSDFWKSLLNFVVTIGKGIISALKDFFTKTGLVDIWNSIKSWITEKMKNIPKFFQNVGIRIVNAIIDGLNTLSNFTIPGFSIGKWKIWDDTNIKLFNIPRIQERAKGGMLDEVGSLYRVGEGGAELVAQSAKGTGVTNIDQFTEAMLNALIAYGEKEAINAGFYSILSNMDKAEDNSSRTYVSKQSIQDMFLRFIDEALAGKGRRTLSQITAY